MVKELRAAGLLDSRPAPDANDGVDEDEDADQVDMFDDDES